MEANTTPQDEAWSKILNTKADKFPEGMSTEDVFLTWVFKAIVGRNEMQVVPGKGGDLVMELLPNIKDAPQFGHAFDVEKRLIDLDKNKRIRYDAIPKGVTIH